MEKNKCWFARQKSFFCHAWAIASLLLALPALTRAQSDAEKGLPFITNYAAKEYQAHPQNWAIAQDNQGILYVGNSICLLEYDGVKWRKINLGVNTVIRSLGRDKNGRIYYGSYGDFGYLEPDSVGQVEEHSLLQYIPQRYRKFNDIWTTYATPDGIYFQSRERIFRLRPKHTGTKEDWEVKVWESPNKFMYAFYLDGTYYVHQQGVGLSKMAGDALVFIPGSEFTGKERMQIMLPYPQDGTQKQYLIGLFYSGLYIYNGKTFRPLAAEANPIFKSSTLYKGALLSDGSYALATTGKGLIIMNPQGKTLRLINRDVGLQDESVYAVFPDKNGAVWLGLDNGISRIETTSPFTQFTIQSGITTAVLSAARFERTLYIGTSNGLLRFNKETSKFESVKSIQTNQVFGLIQDDGKLLIPTDGLFYIKDGETHVIRASYGGDLQVQSTYLLKKNPGVLLTGLAGGLAMFSKHPNAKSSSQSSTQWTYIGKFNNITEDTWSVVERNDGSVWLGGINGVIRLSNFVDKDGVPAPDKARIERFGPAQGLSGGAIHVFSIPGKELFVSNSGVFRYDEAKNRFVPDNSFGPMGFGNDPNEYNMTVDQRGRIWINFGKETALAIPQGNGTYRIEKVQFLPFTDRVVFKIYPEDNGIVWFATNEGLIRYDENRQKDYTQSFKTLLRKITAGETALSTVAAPAGHDRLPFKNNTLRFEYAAPWFEKENRTKYQTWLEGFEPGWSGWDNNSYKEYTNLPDGNFKFHVRALNIYQKPSEEAIYNFIILPPWWRTWWAYLFYALVVVGAIYALIRWRTNKLQAKHRELEKIVSERTAELSHRVEELAVINSVQEALVSEMSMEGIYEMVGEKIREIFNAQVIDIVTYDKNTGLLKDHYSYEKGDRTLVGTWEPTGFRKHVIETGQVFIINKDLDAISEQFGSSVIYGEQPKSCVFVPLISNGEVKGMISLQDLDKENAFSDSAVNLLTTLGNSMSVALESARRFDETNRLLKETEQRNAELAVINSVQDGLVREMDMQGIYDLVGEKMREIFNPQVIDIVTYDSKANLIEDKYSYEKGDRTLVGPREPKGFRKYVINTGQILLHNNNVEKAMREFGNEILIGEMPKSQIYVPMMAAGKVTGIISLQNIDHENAFSNSDVSLLSTLANSMSVALESARLFDETARLLKETEQRTAELGVINSVQDGLAKELDMQAIYELVGDRIRDVFNAQAVIIATLDQETGMEHFKYNIEKGERYYFSPRPYDKLRQHLIDTGEKILINKDPEEAMVRFGMKVLPGTEFSKSLLFVPLISGDKVKSYVSLQNIDEENAFTESDVRLLETLANSMSVALENARLFDETNRLLKETEQRNAELAVINSVQESLVAQMDMQGIYELVGEKMREIFQPQVIDIVTYDGKTNLIEDRYAYEKGDRTLLGPRLVKGFRKHVIETGQVLLHNDNVEQAMNDFDNEILIGEIPKSQVYVPMIAAGKVTGIISLQNIDHENAFSESDVSLLTTLANSMSVALESARLFDETNRLLKETEQRNAELAIINSVQEGLASKMEMQAMYDLVGDKIQSIFDAQMVDIVTYEASSNLIYPRYVIERGERFYEDPRPLIGFRKHVVETRQPILINQDIEKHSAAYGNPLVVMGEASKAVLFVPMMVGGEVKGIISLQNLDRENAFSESDVSLLTTLANSMSVALEGARLFDETNRLLKETEQRNAELAVINSVQESLVAQMDMQGIYDLVGEKMREIFNAQVIDIVTYDAHRNLIEDRYAYEKGDRTMVSARPPYGFRKHVIESRQTLVINRDMEKVRQIYDNRVIVGQRAKSIVLVPMMAGGEVTGVISLQNLDQEDAFSESDISLLATLTNSMSVALKSARLFDETVHLLKETEQRTAELAIINSVQEGLASKLDMQAIYDLVGDKIRDVFSAQGIAIAYFDRQTNLIHHPYYLFRGNRVVQQPFELGKGLTSHIIETGHPLLINENAAERYKELGAVFAPSETEETAKSWLGVPLTSNGQVCGTIRLENYEREFAYSESDVSLLQTLANSMSVALENARLFDETNRLLKETEQRTAELAVINSVQEGLAKELDMQAIYDLIGNKVHDVFGAQAVIIAALEQETGLEHFKYVIEKGERYYPETRRYDKLRQHLVDTKEKILINNHVEDAMVKFGLKVLPGTELARSLLFVPLISGDKVKSYVSLQYIDKENAFTESDVRLLETLANSMSVALENARLFDETNRLLKETEQRTSELAVINSVQDGLGKELDMQAIYELVGDRIRDVFNAQAVIIATLDQETGMEHFKYLIEKGERYYPEARPLDKLRRRLVQSKQKIVIKTIEESEAWFGKTTLPGTEPMKSGIFVPLIIGDKINSYVSLQNVDREYAFSDSDIRLLETLANSMSVALENARLFDETNRLLKETELRKAELATINNVQEGLVKEFKSEAIFELVGERLCQLFDTQTVLIRTFDHATGMEHWRYAIEKGKRHYTEPRPLIWANKRLIQTHQPILINENYVETAKKYGGTGVSMGMPPKSAVFVPMVVGDEVRGSVSLQNVDKENAFKESDLKLLTTLTNSMGVALENVRLFDETSRLLDETKQRANELSTVNSISKALASQLNPDELIELVGNQMKDLFHANIVYVALLNPKNKTIHFPYQYGDDMRPIKLGEGLTSRVILTGEPLLVNKDVQELRAQLGVRRIGIPAASYLGVPIPVGDEIIGVLSVQSTEHENRFNENDLRLLSTIASSVGVALRNAKLFEEVKKSKREAEAASKAAEKANEAKSAFLSTVSHELRTPLTSVLGFAKIIRKRLEEKIFPTIDKTDTKNEKVVNQITENLGVVIAEGERLTHLINDVLDLAKIEAGKMEWNYDNVSLAEVAERAIAATTSLFDQKGLKLEKQIEPDLPSISGDRDKLIQVIINLISNAVKFTNQGSVTCRVYQQSEELVVDIADTGIGIAAADHAAVFEQFKQVGGDTLTDKPKGTGLGLPICKQIVEHHGGRIWLHSEPGKGSTFSFAIPIVKKEVLTPVHLNELLKQLKEQMAQSKFKTEGKNATILVVDDDDSIRSLLHQELSDAGYLIEEATNGKQALERVRQNRPDLIILDIMMPEMNGFDVAAILKNDPETMDIPIIVLSIVQDKARGFRIGVDRYLTKPIDTAQLFTEVGALLDQGKSKKKVLVVDEDTAAVRSLTDVLQAKGYHVVESDGKEMVEKAIATQPDIIILNSIQTGKNEAMQALRFEKGLENVLFLMYQ